MPRIPIYNAGSEIWQAYLSGLEARRAEEQDRLRKETDARDFEEKKAQFEKQHNLAIKEAEANERARQYQEKINLEKYKIDVNKAMLAGEIPIPGKVTRPEWASINAPETFVPEDYVNETLGIRIPASQLPNRNQYIEAQRQLDSARGAGELERAQAVAKANAEAQAANQAAQDRRFIAAEEGRNARSEAKDLLAEKRLEAMLMRFNASQGNSHGLDSKDLNYAKSVVSSHNSGKAYDSFRQRDEAYNFIRETIKNPASFKGSPGLADLGLIYAYVRGQDPNRVTDTEMALTIKNAMPWLKSQGFKFQGLLNPAPMLDDNARQKILQSIEQRRKAAWNAYLPNRKSSMKLLEKRGIDSTDASEFLGSYPDLESEEEGTPVTLKPKGGKK